MPYLPDLTAHLADGARFREGGEEFTLTSEQVGTAVLPTGRLVGCDPLTYASASEPFTVPVPPGNYPLLAWLATPADGKPVTAALELRVTGVPATRWEMALIPGQDVIELDEDGFVGYPVDAGCGTLADEVAVRALAAWEYDRLEAAFIPARIPPPPATIGAVTDEATGANVVTVSSGAGDGEYPTYIGRAVDGTVTRVVTIFVDVAGDDD